MRHIQIIEMTLGEHRDMRDTPITIQLSNGVEITLQVEGRRKYTPSSASANNDGTERPRVQCPDCEFTAVNNKGLYQHRYREHKFRATEGLPADSEGTYPCEYCTHAPFGAVPGLTSHMRSAHPKEWAARKAVKQKSAAKKKGAK